MSFQNLTKEEAFEELKKVHPRAFQTTLPTTKLPFFVPFATPESLKELASLPLDPSDVFIVGYPKSGTTWIQNILKLIRNNGERDGIDLQISVPWVEGNSKTNFITGKKIDLNSMQRPRAFKSHMTYETMPCGRPDNTPCKYIYVIRNPKDVAVSYYFNYCRMGSISTDQLDWDLFCCNFIHGNLAFGNIFNHVLSWWPHRNEHNVLFLTYEEMKKDHRGAVVRVANFIGADVTEGLIDKIVAETTFEEMKADQFVNYSKHDKPGIPRFMRKGEVGDWKNYFTPEQSAEVDKICQERLEGTGLVFDFGDN